MGNRQRSTAVAGVLLILLGAWFLAAQIVPGLKDWFDWPFIIIGVGVFLLILGLLTNTPDLAVPACIVGGIGGLLSWQNATGNWESWAYAWTLIPGFVGVGVILSKILSRNVRHGLGEGGTLIMISLIMFLVFGSFLGPLGLGPLGSYWPVLIIGLGVLMLIRTLFRR